ncbi:hypothetical protein Bbelb_036930 [Branchiostoma belcheri]|nr:hypothetical protein Bbelb_036930 [Branchiostoma belcheri]
MPKMGEDSSCSCVRIDAMFSFIIVSTIFLFGLAARILGSIGNALNAAIGVERCEVEIPPFVDPPSVPLQEAVKKTARRSDLNGPTDYADTPKNKPAEPDKPIASVRAPGTANTGKPKGTFGGMKSGFLLQKKSQPKTETTAKADAPKATLPQQQPKNTGTAGQKDRPTAEARQVEGNISPRQKKADDPPRPKTEAGQKQASRPSADSETGQTARPQTPPILPVLAQLTPILLPVPCTNQATLIWDGSRKARNWLAMIVAARRASSSCSCVRIDAMFSFIIVSTIFLFGLAARILGSIGNALNAAIGVERREVKIPPFVEPPSVPLQEAVKKTARRSDLNGPTNHADTPKNKPAEPDKPSASVRAPGTANTGKPKGTFGGMKPGFLLQKKSQPKAETAAKADAPKATLPEQQPKNTSAGQKDRPTAEARQVKGNISPRQKKVVDPPRPKTETGQKQASRPSADSETGQSARPQTPPIYPVLALLTPILLPVPGTNQATLIWDGTRKARNWLAMIVAARRAAAGL